MSASNTPRVPCGSLQRLDRLVFAGRKYIDMGQHMHTRAFRAKLVPLQGALYDERLYTVLR